MYLAENVPWALNSFYLPLSKDAQLAGDGPIMPRDGPIMPGDSPIMPGDGPIMPGDDQ